MQNINTPEIKPYAGEDDLALTTRFADCFSFLNSSEEAITLPSTIIVPRPTTLAPLILDLSNSTPRALTSLSKKKRPSSS